MKNMKKTTRKLSVTLILAILIFLFALAPVFSDVPVRKEQLIYSILAFVGKEYTGTFCRQDADTFYLMADVDNFITIRKTLVYFWPITQDWKVDTEALNIPFEGTLIIEGKDIGKKEIKQVKYTYYNAPGEYEVNWKVFTGKDADKEWQKYSKIVDAYWKAVEKYYAEKSKYEAELTRLTREITKARDEGKDTKRLLAKLKTLKQPKEPTDKAPKYYVKPVEKAFVLNLPVGEYSVKFINKDGKVMEGSEKKIVVFGKRRSNGIGYDVIPGDKWTRPVQSATPSSVLYIDGTTDLYLRPYYQDEFNDLYYNKMVKNDAKGNPNIMKWVRIQQVPKARVELIKKESSSEVILEKPYYVQQTQGSSLGYKIVPFDPKKYEGRQPSLRAFKVPISRNLRSLKFRLQDKNGKYLSGSDREIRIIVKSNLQIILLILALFPIGLMFIVLAIRGRKYSSG